MSLALFSLRGFCRCSLVKLIQKSYCHTLKKETLPRSIYKHLSDEPSEIFTYIEKNQEYLSGQHCIEALAKLKKSSIKYQEINKIEFSQLCNELKKRITSLDVSEVVVAIDALTKLHVPAETVLYESLLQIIRSNINSLTIEDVISLILNLKNVSKTPLVNGIMLALPTIFEIQLPRVNRSNINLLAICLVYATSLETININSICIILNAISKYENEIPLKAAKLIHKGLRFVPNTEIDYSNILRRVQATLLNEVSMLTFDDAMVILNTMRDSRKLKEFYNEHLVDGLVNSVIMENDLGLEKGTATLRKLMMIGHEHIPLLDYVATKFLEESTLSGDIHPKDLVAFTSAISISDYKPVFWDRIQELILDNTYLQIDRQLIDVVVNLAILDCYSSKLLKMVFRQYTQTDLMDSKTKKKIVKLYQIVKALHVEYDGPFPFEKNLEDLFDWSQYNMRPFPLWKPLEFANGGAEFVETKVGTKLGHFIDHVLICDRETASPLPIIYKNGQRDILNIDNCLEKPITFLEDIVVPKDSQVLLFVDIPENGYTINTMQLTGHWNSYIKTLEAMEYLVIPICSNKWLQLQNREKIPHLMHAIRLKCAINEHRL